MARDLLLIFTLNNDATRTWLNVFGLSDCFDEDDNILAISFDVQENAQTGSDIVPDLLILYDMIPDRGMLDVLAPFVRESSKIYTAFHRGLDTPADRVRVQEQRERLSGLCGEKLNSVYLVEHSTCGPVFDFLRSTADAVRSKNRILYRTVLSDFRELFSVDPLLEEKLAFLHDVSTPEGAADMLTRAQENLLSTGVKSFWNLSVPENPHTAANRRVDRRVADLVVELSCSRDCFSADYRRTLTSIKRTLISG
jgi:hypothetical protein